MSGDSASSSGVTLPPRRAMPPNLRSSMWRLCLLISMNHLRTWPACRFSGMLHQGRSGADVCPAVSFGRKGSFVQARRQLSGPLPSTEEGLAQPAPSNEEVAGAIQEKVAVRLGTCMYATSRNNFTTGITYNRQCRQQLNCRTDTSRFCGLPSSWQHTWQPCTFRPLHILLERLLPHSKRRLAQV